MLGDQLDHSLAAIADHDRYIAEFLAERAALKSAALEPVEVQRRKLSFVHGMPLFRRSKPVH